MEKEYKIGISCYNTTTFKLRVLIGLLVILVGILLFYTIPALSWEEITVWDHHDWSSSSEISVIPYSKWDSQTGSSDGYIYIYRRSMGLKGTIPLLREQEIERSEWWRKDYKEWLQDQGVDKGLMMGW